jgi:hypothetical protein
MTGCSEKFNVAAPYKNITVVYGLMDMADTAHYIRIQKAFLDEHKSAVTMAQNADSNFYPNLDVIVRKVDFQENVQHDIIHLKRVDLNLEGYPKQPGTFFTAPNYAYKFTDQLDPQYYYRVVITNPVTGEVDSAESPVINDKNNKIFHVDMLDDTALNRGGLDFAKTPVSSMNTVTFNVLYPYTQPGYTYSFHGQTNAAGIAQGYIRFNWVDSNISTGEKSGNKYYDFDLGYQTLLGNQQATYKINDIDLYAAMSRGMGDPPPYNVRLLDRCDIAFYLGTPDYYTYYQASLTQGTGLTGSEIEPYYTNIKGKNVLGLFTGRGVRGSTPGYGKLKITPITIDSLMISPVTSHIQIKGTVYH